LIEQGIDISRETVRVWWDRIDARPFGNGTSLKL